MTVIPEVHIFVVEETSNEISILTMPQPLYVEHIVNSDLTQQDKNVARVHQLALLYYYMKEHTPDLLKSEPPILPNWIERLDLHTPTGLAEFKGLTGRIFVWNRNLTNTQSV